MRLPVIKLNKIFNYKNTLPSMLKAFIFTITFSSLTILTSCSDENFISPNDTNINNISKSQDTKKINIEPLPYLNKTINIKNNNDVKVQIYNQTSGTWIDLEIDDTNSLKPKRKLFENEEFTFKNQTKLFLKDILVLFDLKLFNDDTYKNSNNEISIRIVGTDNSGNSSIIEEINKIQVDDIKTIKECKVKVREKDFK